MGFGREGAICEQHVIMQIPPRFEQRSGAYKSVAPDLQHARRRRNLSGLGTSALHGNDGTSRFLNSRRNNHKLRPACIVVAAIDRYQTYSMRKPGSADRKISGSE